MRYKSWIVLGAVSLVLNACGTKSGHKSSAPPEEDADKKGEPVDSVAGSNVMGELEALNAKLLEGVDEDLLWSVNLGSDMIARQTSFEALKANLAERNLDEFELAMLTVKVVVIRESETILVATNIKDEALKSSDIVIQSVWNTYCDSQNVQTKNGKLRLCNFEMHRKRAVFKKSVVSCDFIGFNVYTNLNDVSLADQALCSRANNSEHPDRASAFYPTAKLGFKIETSDFGGLDARFEIGHNIGVACRDETPSVTLQTDVDAYVSVDFPVDSNKGLPNYRNPDHGDVQNSFLKAVSFYGANPENSRKLTVTSRCTWVDFM